MMMLLRAKTRRSKMKDKLSPDKQKVPMNLARLKYSGENFEIVVDADKAVQYRNGSPIELREVLMAEKVFSDAHKGFVVSEAAMKSAFNTADPLEIAKVILKKGEIQLTAEYRQKLRDEKKRRIIEIIHRNGVDPRTSLPHPPQRIENAMLEAKVAIDEHKRAEDQVQDILKRLRAVLPIKFEIREIAVRIPAEYAAKSYSVLKNFGVILKDEWQNDGSLVSLVEMPAGLQQGFFDALNSLTHGNAETKIVRTK